MGNVCPGYLVVDMVLEYLHMAGMRKSGIENQVMDHWDSGWINVAESRQKFKCILDICSCQYLNGVFSYSCLAYRRIDGISLVDVG